MSQLETTPNVPPLDQDKLPVQCTFVSEVLSRLVSTSSETAHYGETERHTRFRVLRCSDLDGLQHAARPRWLRCFVWLPKH